MGLLYCTRPRSSEYSAIQYPSDLFLFSTVSIATHSAFDTADTGPSTQTKASIHHEYNQLFFQCLNAPLLPF